MDADAALPTPLETEDRRHGHGNCRSQLRQRRTDDAWTRPGTWETEKDMAAYLKAAQEDGDLNLVMATLADITRARQMSALAQETGLSGESLYESLSADDISEFT